jgi:hypothetical protein
MQDGDDKTPLKKVRPIWDKPILASKPHRAGTTTHAAKINPVEQPDRPKRLHPASRLWLAGIIGLVIGAVGTAGGLTQFPQLAVTPKHTPVASETTAVTPPAKAPPPADQPEAFDGFIRLATSPVSTTAVEGAFRSYIAVSSEVLKVHNDHLVAQVAGLGLGLAAAVERRYLEPLLQAGVHYDDCAAGVLAARLDGPFDPAQASEIAAIKVRSCATTGSLESLGFTQLGTFIATCKSRLSQVMSAHRAGTFNAPAFIETAVDLTKIETNPCPDPARYIKVDNR